MPRSLAFLKWVRALQQARRLNLGLDDSSAPFPLTPRRRFLKQSALAGASISLASSLQGCVTSGYPPGALRAAVVGAGLAGLNAAYQLHKAGLSVQVFEASDRIGGRIRSVQGALGEGLVTDLGGELVNTDHLDLHGLAAEFGVKLLPRRAEDSDLPEVGYYFAGVRLSEADLAEALRPFAAQVAIDSALLDEDWDRWGPHFDRQSLADYLQQHRALLPANPDLYKLIVALVRVEYGVEPSQSSALQLLYLLPVVKGEQVELLSTSDEAWVIDGGSERLIQELHKALGERVRTNMALSHLERLGDAYQLRFANGRSALAEYVVLALPPTALRKVEMRLDLPDTLRRFITEVDLGYNEKIVAGVTERVWRRAGGFEIEAWNDQSVALLWDSSLRELNSHSHGALTFFLGGDEVAAAESSSTDQHGRRLMHEYDALIPGLEASANGNFLRTAWHKTSGIHGGYTNLKPGQYTDFAAEWMYVESEDPEEVQDVHVDRLVLAGEHTSDEFYGFMNGAAQSGRLAAQWIMRDLLERVAAADQPSVERQFG